MMNWEKYKGCMGKMGKIMLLQHLAQRLAKRRRSRTNQKKTQSSKAWTGGKLFSERQSLKGKILTKWCKMQS
jgi:hypothetical protein